VSPIGVVCPPLPGQVDTCGVSLPKLCLSACPLLGSTPLLLRSYKYFSFCLLSLFLCLSPLYALPLPVPALYALPVVSMLPQTSPR
jgi:hypothetical protein